MSISSPTSLTHQHIAAALNTEQRKRNHVGDISVLDAGCGRGQLTGFLHAELPRMTGRAFELHGFDVIDWTSVGIDFPAATIAMLSGVDPNTPWDERITAISTVDPWPYPDQSFSYVVSNQVLEHVSEPLRFLSEVRRVLEPGGLSIHLFPLSNCLFEGHLLVPLVAQISGHEQRARWLEFMYRAGIGKYSHKPPKDGSDYIHFSTHYRRWSSWVALAKRVGLRISYRYTVDLYRQKARQLRAAKLLDQYPERNPVLEWATFAVLKYVSSVTVTLERPEADSIFHNE